MTSTDRRSAARAYMRDHDVKYTEALRALQMQDSTPVEPTAKYMLLSWDQHDYLHPTAEGTMYETLADAKAASREDGDVVTTGFFAPDVPGGPSLWHNYPYGNGFQRQTDYIRAAMFGHPIFWDAAPRIASGWSLSWFRRFPTPQAAAASPGLANGYATDGLSGDAYRFVDESGALVTRLLPDLSDEVQFARFTAQRNLLPEEMRRIAASLDPGLGIRLREALTPYGTVHYWEFRTPNLANFVSWSSVERHTGVQTDALRPWVVDDFPHVSTINALPFEPLEVCDECDDEPVTRNHPLAPGSMIGTSMLTESAVPIDMPMHANARNDWETLLLVHVLGSPQLFNHDRCAAYWGDPAD